MSIMIGKYIYIYIKKGPVTSKIIVTDKRNKFLLLPLLK